MKIVNKKMNMLVVMVTIGIFVAGCYEEFDPNSYKPEFTISGFAAVSDIEPTSLVSYWSFDGTLNDVVSGATGTNKGSTFINGFKGQAVNFNATDKTYLTAQSPATITGLQSFTISFWTKPSFVDTDANNGIDGVLGLVGLSNTSRFWGNIEWFVENNSNPNGAIIKVIMTNGTQETDIVVSGYKGLFGNWSNHTLTYDAGTSTLKYYINGSQQATKVTPWTGPLAFTSSGPMVFGAVQFQTTPSLTTSHGTESWASWLTGALDEVRIYNKALNATDINALVVLQGKGK